MPEPIPADRRITIHRELDAPRSLVWEVWTAPAHIALWWGPRAFTTRVEEHELRVGGPWRYTMVGSDGAEHGCRGEFLILEPEERLVTRIDFDGPQADDPDLPHGMELTVRFEALDGERTRVSLDILHRSEADRDRHLALGVVDGWGSSLDCLADQLSVAAADREILLTRHFTAPPARLFDAFTDPAQLAHWFGPRGFSLTTHAADFTPGGSWSFTMHGPDGRDYENRVEFLEVLRPSRLVYRHVGGEDVRFATTVRFTPEGGGTRLTMVMEFASAAERERVERSYGAVEGGLGTFGRLADHLGGEQRGLTVAHPHARQTILRRVFAAPRALVFEAFTRPEHIERWWGPRDKTMVECAMDFRPGGSWRFVLRDPDGRVLPFSGEFREIVPPERIVQSFSFDMPGASGPPSIETLTLHEVDQRTVLTIVAEHAASGACSRSSGMEGGARESYDRLEELLGVLAAGRREARPV